MNKFNNEKTIQTEFSKMLSVAKSHFKTYGQKKRGLHQFLILCTSQGEYITCPINVDSVELLKSEECTILSNLEQSYGNTVVKIVCMWEGETIDVPSYKFMQMLCDINPDNKNAEILLSAGQDAYVTKKIAEIIG